MSSRPTPEPAGSHSSHPRPDGPLGAMPPSDDTPTIISKKVPAPAAPYDGNPAAIRGLKLAHFELIEPIGVGGMAAVLRARDTQLDRLVALKILPQEMAADPENIKRFHQEARSAARLDHENIARVFFCGEDQRLHFIAFEFVEGDNLRAIIDRRGRLPVNEALHYLLQVAAGLAHAARRGVVHRDIKPSNIIVMPNGRAKLVDMGLARCLGARGDDDLTQSGVTLGTFDYISPEQALEPRDADVRSDIYSTGCTFYHALTGRAPVPEGTAAKKLHHHQHVAPPDPRQYVPALPAEVVQLLGRMMAKSPRDRFQTPEELVQHTLAIARKLGAVPDGPEGVLTVDTTLPARPAGRPLVWAALAAAAVVGLVLLLDQAPGGAPPGGGLGAVRPDAREGDGGENKGGASARGPDDRGKRAEPPPAKAVYTQAEGDTLDDLRAWLDKHRDEESIELRLSRDLALTPPEGKAAPGLVVQARDRVVIKARHGAQPTLRFTYDAGWAGASFAALTVIARESHVEGLRVVVDAALAEVELAGLVIQGGVKHTVRACEFLQAQPSLRPGGARLASLRLEAGRMRAAVSVQECAFRGFGQWARRGEAGDLGGLASVETGGRDAVVRKGAVRVSADNCVFGPHEAAFRLEGAAGDDAGAVAVSRCSVLLAPRRSAAFDVAAGASGKLDVTATVIARHAGPAEDGAVVLRQADDEAAVVYQGQGNRYFDLDGYWAVRGGWQKAGWGDFKRRLDEAQAGDASQVLLSWPWQAAGAKQTELLEGLKWAQAFAVSLQQPALRKQPNSAQLVGATGVLGEVWHKDVPALDEGSAVSLPRALVVEGGARDDSQNGVYRTLELAALSARPGDVILLRHTGEMSVGPVVLNRKEQSDLTIRPARKFRPVLVLQDAAEDDVSMFRVQDGRLRLEGLELRLLARRDYKAQAVVALAGDGVCVLKGCAVTLAREGDMTSLSVATLPELSKAMMKLDAPARTRDQGPRLALEDCFVRGDGDLLAARASRPCALSVKTTLAALSGSLLNAEVSGDGKAPAPAQQLSVTLSQVTAYLGVNLVRLYVTKGTQGLVPIRCDANECAFAPAGSAKTLIALEGSETEDKSLRAKFAWSGGKNAYGPYTSLLTETGGDEMPAPMSAEKWKMQMNEEGSVFGMKLAAAPAADAAFAEVQVADIKLPGSAGEFGAPPAKLPRPAK